MTICSPEAGDIARGRSPRAILPVEGEQIVLLYRTLFETNWRHTIAQTRVYKCNYIFAKMTSEGNTCMIMRHDRIAPYTCTVNKRM